ncbi:hypothetical protein D9M68_961570 [compost metagenome]
MAVSPATAPRVPTVPSWAQWQLVIVRRAKEDRLLTAPLEALPRRVVGQGASITRRAVGRPVSGIRLFGYPLSYPPVGACSTGIVPTGSDPAGRLSGGG